MEANTGNLLVELREGSDVHHRRVQKHALIEPFMASVISVEQYSRVIAAFAGFYATLESRVAELSSRIELPDYRYEPRLPLLVEDLASLPTCTITACPTVPEFSREDELVGVLYVIEGATQGGTVIGPLVQKTLALTDTSGAQYFNFYRQGSWQKFRAMVERRQQDYDSRLAVAAAQTTFDHLHCHFDLCFGRPAD